MSKYAIIRANINGGKTTTCGFLYEELLKKSEYSWLYNTRLEPISRLEYGDNGNLYDFVAIIVIDGFVIVIVSQGDVAKALKAILDKLEGSIGSLTGSLFNIIDLVVCCGRSQMRKGSTIEMLHDRVYSENRKEFWTKKSDDREHWKEVKQDVIDKIVRYINIQVSLKGNNPTISYS